MPIYNQKNQIFSVLNKIVINLKNKSSLIIIDDASEDESGEEVIRFINEVALSNEKIVSIIFITNHTPIYETACDNQGFLLAKTEYIIEVQADIHIEELDFDQKMIDSMATNNLGAVSGRLAHSFSIIDYSPKWKKWFKYPRRMLLKKMNRVVDGVGLIDERIFTGELINVSKNQLTYIAETVARGPWLIKKSDLEKVNYLDEKNFFLGHDDHDYHRKIWVQLGKHVGYVPIKIFSFAEHGSTRKIRGGLNLEIYRYLVEHKNGAGDYRKFLDHYIPYQEIQAV